MKTIEIKPNIVYSLGEHRLVMGDSRDPAVINKLCAEEKVNLVLTDVPYGVAAVESKASLTKTASIHEAIIGDQLQTDEEYIAFTKAWVTAIKPHLAAKNSWYVFQADKKLLAMLQAFKEERVYFSQLLIWVKSQPVMGRLDYQPMNELIAYAWSGTHRFRKSKDKSVIFCPKPRKNTLHPSQKPISLLRRLILNSTNMGDIVWDGFGGVGSTLLAAEQTGRRCFMAELSEKYCRITMERYTKLIGVAVEEVVATNE